MGHGIAPQRARATTTVDMNKAKEFTEKVPNWAQDSRDGTTEDLKMDDKTKQTGRKLQNERKMGNVKY